jgi:hypothetical protein
MSIAERYDGTAIDASDELALSRAMRKVPSIEQALAVNSLQETDAEAHEERLMRAEERLLRTEE